MEDKKEIDEMLVRLLLDEGNKEEEIFLLNWLKADELNRQYFEQLKSTWQLLALKQTADRINIAYELRQVKQMITRRHLKVVHVDPKESPGNKHINEEYKGRAIVSKVILSTAVAALMLLVIGLGWRAFQNKKPTEQLIGKNIQKIRNPNLSLVRHEINNSGKLKQLILQDGTEILLFDKSEVSFQEPFTGNRRDITLKGKADFKVAKDKTRPFTVFTGDIATTVLGTKFTITAFQNMNDITVALYEGRVVVKSAENVTRKLSKDYYLLPGQQLIYDKSKSIIKLRANKTGNSSKENKSNKDNLSIPQYHKGSWFMFNNQPLGEVFDHLSVMYRVKIVYLKRDVDHINFIGTFEQSDSLEHIIKQIAALNQLKVTKEENRFIINK
jgi:transmembrane sensor